MKRRRYHGASRKAKTSQKAKGLTQEQPAEKLYVSRTAVSKWESARGCPGLDSLKALAEFFGVTVDSLLSGKEPPAAEESAGNKRAEALRSLIFGLTDLSVLLIFFSRFSRRERTGLSGRFPCPP